MVEVNPTYLTGEDLSDRLKRSVGTLANWRYKGIGPKYLRFGERGRVLYNLKDIEEWEAIHTIKTNITEPVDAP